jgi:Tol biopolymer transport system component
MSPPGPFVVAGGNGQNPQTVLASGVSFGEISPDGTRIAYILNGTPSQLVVANTDGTGPVPVASQAVFQRFTWSPDGLTIIYAAEPRRPGSQLVVATGATWRSALTTAP